MESLNNAFTESPEMPGSIAFFDDECLVCNGFVQFLIRHDSGKKSFVFAALQSDYGQAIAHKITSRLGNKETIAFLENGQLYTQSTALLKLLRKLGGRWKIL